MAKRRRGGGDDGTRRAMEREQRRHQNEQQDQEQEKQRLYLVFEEDPFGYSIRKIRLSPPTSRRQTRPSSSSKENASASGKGAAVRRLPHPIIRLEARQGLPMSLAAIGTRIAITHCLDPYGSDDPDFLIPIYDVRRRAVTFGPGKFSDDGKNNPIHIAIGDELFALDSHSLSKLSFKSQRPPPLDLRQSWVEENNPWSWQPLPPPPFATVDDVSSYAVHPDGKTILVGTDVWWPDDPYAWAGTFTFDTSECKWERHDWALQFAGPAYYVHCLKAFVGLSKDPTTLGHLALCGGDGEAVTCPPPAAWKLGKENLFSDDPVETHVSAKLLFTGRGSGSEFCLVQCVSVKPGNGNGNGNADDNNNLEDEEPGPSCCYRYRLTTFCLSYDDNGDLTTGDTSWVQCYEVPRETTQRFIDLDEPVAFWL